MKEQIESIMRMLSSKDESMRELGMVLANSMVEFSNFEIEIALKVVKAIDYFGGNFFITEKDGNYAVSLYVDGNIDVQDKHIKGVLDFSFGEEGEISGDFNCSRCSLISLVGAPKIVGGNFISSDNQLTNLEGGPEIVSGDFICQFSGLKSLAGAPSQVGRDFIVSFNQISSLAGAPAHVGRDFKCCKNELVSLEGCSFSKILGDFDVMENKLKSLDGCPEKIGRNFNCSHNSLESLAGGPSEVGGKYDCGHNKLMNLDNLPKSIPTFCCWGNPCRFEKSYIQSKASVAWIAGW